AQFASAWQHRSLANYEHGRAPGAVGRNSLQSRRTSRGGASPTVRNPARIAEVAYASATYHNTRIDRSTKFAYTVKHLASGCGICRRFSWRMPERARIAASSVAVQPRRRKALKYNNAACEQRPNPEGLMAHIDIRNGGRRQGQLASTSNAMFPS